MTTRLKQKQQGAALLTVLVIVLFATTLAVGMMSSTALDIKRVSYNKHTRQVYHYAMGVESWALGRLYKDAKDNNNNGSDSFKDVWNNKFKFAIVNNEANVQGSIVDQQSKFNVNNLAFVSTSTSNPTPTTPPNGATQPPPTGGAQPAPVGKTVPAHKQYHKTLSRLLSSLELDPALASVIVDWVDSNNTMYSASGAEDDSYLDKQPAYRTPNVTITSIKELKQAKGITPKIFEKLKPYITALPTQTKINVNTAPPEVLKSLSPDMNDQLVDLIIQTRKESPYKDVNAFINQIKAQIKPRVLNPANLSEIVTVKSEFFLCHSSVTMKEAKLELRSLIFRSKQSMQIVSRQSGKE